MEATSQPKDVVESGFIENILLCTIIYSYILYTTLFNCYLKGKILEVNCAEDWPVLGELLLLKFLCAISLELPAKVGVLQI